MEEGGQHVVGCVNKTKNEQSFTNTTISYTLARMPHDFCVSLRKTYGAILHFLTANALVAGIVGSIPPMYILGFMIYNSTSTTPFIYASYMTGSGYSIFGVLGAAWLLACLSIWKMMPNLLTLSIFVYKCLGHWAFVSFVIVLFYFTHYAGIKVTAYLAAGLLPPVLLLLFAADVMRTQRTKMYAALAAAAHRITQPEPTQVNVLEV